VVIAQIEQEDARKVSGVDRSAHLIL